MKCEKGENEINKGMLNVREGLGYDGWAVVSEIHEESYESTGGLREPQRWQGKKQKH